MQEKGVFMTLEEHYQISFYQPVRQLGDEEHIWLTRHTENGKFYVRKELTDYNRAVYERLRQLDSNWFPHIFEIVEEDGKLIVIEEYISGQTLDKYMNQSQMLTMAQTLSVMMDVCQALKLLHEQTPSIIHRDIKPSNIILSVDGIWKVIDFNTARYYDASVQRDTTFLGTLEYAAPEQFGDIQTDVRTDIYALGAMMNYLLTGKNHKKYVYEGAAGKIIEKCTRFDPNLRYQSVGELVQALKQLPEAGNYVTQDKQIPNREASERLNRKSERANSYKEHSSYHTARQHKDKKKHSWTFWLPPGFRTLKLWKMCMGGLVYALALYISITLEVTNNDGSKVTGTALLSNRIGCWLLFLVLVLFWFNYGGMHRILPLVRKPQIGWKVLGYVVWTCVIFMVIMTGVVILST